MIPAPEGMQMCMCCHIYMHNVTLDDEQKKYFKPERNVIYERHKFG